MIFFLQCGELTVPVPRHANYILKCSFSHFQFQTSWIFLKLLSRHIYTKKLKCNEILDCFDVFGLKSMSRICPDAKIVVSNNFD